MDKNTCIFLIESPKIGLTDKQIITMRTAIQSRLHPTDSHSNLSLPLIEIGEVLREALGGL